MDKRKYKYRADSSLEIEATLPLQYSMCADGYAIYGGTLQGTGFQPYHYGGITLPEEIDGIPVTELHGTYEAVGIGYIEAPCLKRISVCIVASGLFEGDELRCGSPMVIGGSVDPLLRGVNP